MSRTRSAREQPLEGIRGRRCPSRQGLLSALFGSGTRIVDTSLCGDQTFLIPAEDRAVAPHLVQDYGELAGHGHVRLLAVDAAPSITTEPASFQSSRCSQNRGLVFRFHRRIPKRG